jgi:hypothetical protein
LDERQAIDQQDYVKPLMAVFRINAQLTDNFKVVLAPLLIIHQSVMKRRTVLTLKVLPFA